MVCVHLDGYTGVTYDVDSLLEKNSVQFRIDSNKKDGGAIATGINIMQYFNELLVLAP